MAEKVSYLIAIWPETINFEITCTCSILYAYIYDLQNRGLDSQNIGSGLITSNQKARIDWTLKIKNINLSGGL